MTNFVRCAALAAGGLLISAIAAGDRSARADLGGVAQCRTWRSQPHHSPETSRLARGTAAVRVTLALGILIAGLGVAQAGADQEPVVVMTTEQIIRQLLPRDASTSMPTPADRRGMNAIGPRPTAGTVAAGTEK